MESYCENVPMPDQEYKIQSFISTAFEHVMDIHLHWHDEVQILYFIDGYAIQQVNEKIFITEPGDIVIVGAGQLHSTSPYQGSNYKILAIMFNPLYFFGNSLNDEDHASFQFYDNSVLFNNPMKASEGCGKLILDCINNIHHELTDKQNSFRYFTKSYLFRMTGIIMRNQLYENFYESEKNVLVIKQMLKTTFALIDNSYFDNISLSQAAFVSNLSVPHFCRLFKKATGKTFNNYLSFYRVTVAERMLNSQKAITEIALECGFGSLSSFIRCFKNFNGCTPTAYKKL
jgi:AraC family transcriptional activator of pobA